MRRFRFDPRALPPTLKAEWDAWERRADIATGKVMKAHARGQEPSFNQGIWRELKEWFFAHVFHEKCAYCEGETLISTVGDGEHWRPKSAVTTAAGDPVERGGVRHPGYFWLAYDWRNLLPACEKCNRGKGKGTRFPVAGEYAFGPEEGATVAALDVREKPLLLHPFGPQEPSEHISFDEFGQPLARSPEGEASIRVFNLERGPLCRAREKRREQMVAAADDVFHKWHATRGLPVRPSIADLVAAKVEEHHDFSLAREVYIVEHVRARIDELLGEKP